MARLHRHARRRRSYLNRFGSCCYCDSSLDFETSTMEHIIPKSYGGKYSTYNLDICCVDCQKDHSHIYQLWNSLRYIILHHQENEKFYQRIHKLDCLLESYILKKRRRVWNPIYKVWPTVKFWKEAFNVKEYIK